MSNTSAEALDRAKKSGKLGRAQVHYLYVLMALYKETPMETSHMTHEEATEAVFKLFGVRYAPRNSRITELVRMGLIDLAGVKVNPRGEKVNTYIWSGKDTPVETERVLEGSCSKCGSDRKHWVTRPVDKKQGSFLK